MLKVFLVEDEVIVRKAIKNNIPWTQEGYEFVGEAGDGELAYPMIQRLQPDILITDIKMPFMDGLELSEIVRQEFPDIRIIVLSGHDDFSYAQEAIRLGVSAYLLKPIDSKGLLGELAKVAGEISRERQSAGSDIRKKSLKLQEKKNEFFAELVSGTIGFREAMERGMEFQMDFVAPYFQIMRLGLLKRDIEDNCQENIKTCYRRLDSFLNGVSGVRPFEMGVEGWYLILLKDTQEESDKLVEELEQGIRMITEDCGQIEWFAGIGNVVERINLLPQSYKLACKAYAARFFLRRNQTLSYKKVEMQLAGCREDEIDMTDISINKQVSVERFLRRGMRNQAETFVEDYLKTFGEKNLQSLLFRQYTIMNCYFSICNFLKDIGVNDGQLGDFHDMIKNSFSIEDVWNCLIDSLTTALELRDGKVLNKHADLMDKVQQYMREHYREDSLSLNTVADEVHVSPSYLSKIFSQETGRTFVEFLTELRMEQAKELLLCTGMKATNIAYEVGYRDSGYFCQLFKKHMGCTMSEYRMGKVRSA